MMVHVFTYRKNNFIEEIYMTERERRRENQLVVRLKFDMKFSVSNVLAMGFGKKQPNVGF